MPPKSPSLYDLKKTTIWFAMASIILLIGLVAMVLQDSTREWKHYQREFVKLKREKAEAELAATKKKVNQKVLDKLEADLAEAEKIRATHEQQIANLEVELTAIQLDVTKAKTAYQDLVQNRDSEKYYYEEYVHKGKDELAEKYKKLLEAREAEVAAAKLKLEGLEAKVEAKEAEIKAFHEAGDETRREIKKINRDVERLETKVERLMPKWFTDILDAPMLDFIRPNLQIQQIVVEKVQDDYFFAKVEKVDRCITCHLGIDQKGFEDAPQPFTTHPNLDLFLSSKSPHAMEEFGCTVCHGGSGHSASFTTAAHTPQDEKQAKEWKKKHHWHEMKHWTEKMLPLNHVEASCAKCHTGTLEVPEAPKLNEGRHLARTYGCTSCHKVAGMEEKWNAGPSLEHVQSKLDQDWIIRWLHDPKEFRASTKMPRVFHLSNTSDPESKETSNTTIAGIATYLMKNSDPVSLEKPPVKGNPEVGEKLVEEIGCLGCHTVGKLNANNHGPELTGMGSKVTEDWLYTWLKDPHHYFEDTRMPELRLTDQEAADITAYLLQSTNDKFESTQLPHVDPASVEKLSMTFLKGNLREEEAKAKLEKMGLEERLEFIGEKSIAHQGCYACHTIKGFEAAAPIGVELTNEGSKEVKKFDFGFVHIPHTRQDWIFQKLKEPRVFDGGKVRSYHEKLRMPHFGFTDEQAEALTTFVLSLQDVDIPLEMQRRLSQSDEKIEAGRYLVAKYNCQGCHTMDGKDGKVRSIIEDLGNAPPILWGQGKKVQPEWLYEFLEMEGYHHGKEVTVIRPWLKYRMPGFEFNEEQLTTLVEYFHNLDEAGPDFRSVAPEASAEQLKAGHELFDQLQCIKCHKSNPDPSLSASFLAPDLVMSKERLKPDWVVDWLRDPQAEMPGTMMPGFFPDGETPLPDILGGDVEKQMQAIRDYLWMFTGEEAVIATKVSGETQS